MTTQNDKSQGNVVLYQAPDGTVELDVRLERETVWLNQRQMAVLFDKDADTIGLHIRNTYKEGELESSASSVVQVFVIQFTDKLRYFGFEARYGYFPCFTARHYPLPLSPVNV